MGKNKRTAITRKLLIAAAVMAFILTIINSLQLYWVERRSMSECILTLVRTMLPVLFFFAALRFPTMIYSTALAGIGAFWSVLVLFMVPPMLYYKQYSASAGYGAVIMAACTVGLILAIMGAAAAVSWIRELRDRGKAEDAAEGIEPMTRGLITFLRPRMTDSLVLFILLTLLTVTFFRQKMIRVSLPRDMSELIILVCTLALPVGALLLAIQMIKAQLKYDRYVNDLKDTGAAGQAALDYHKGRAYCNGKVILGSQYIFVEGAGLLTQYSDLVKIYHDYNDSSKYRHWYLIAVNKDGKAYRLVNLPYIHTQNNYNEYVQPMLDKIRFQNPEILIEGPGNFRK